MDDSVIHIEVRYIDNIIRKIWFTKNEFFIRRLKKIKNGRK